MPKRKMSIAQRRAISESLRMIAIESSAEEPEVETEVEEDTEDLRTIRNNRAKDLREERRENRKIKRDASRKIREIELAESDSELPEIVVTQHYYEAGEMVMHRRQKTIGLVLDTKDRIISRYSCGATREVAKCDSVSVLIGGDIQEWRSKFVLPVSEQ